ncbi:MAG: ATP-dependent RecD-like DNA helicase [Anaerolineae bacterium]|nr:ATP-dependent RecD-like DNA helicase [Anaerolineae bacterium]
MEMLKGSVERITFYNEENGYSVIKIKADKRYPAAEARDGTITVVGVMPEINVGENIQFDGDWVEDPKYGKQFRAEMTTPMMPTTDSGIVSYLSSGIVKGIGPKTAQKIVDHFGSETINILDTQPGRLHEVPGLKRDLAKSLIIAWAENQAVRQTMVFLHGYGVSSKMATRIYQHYGYNTITTVKENPYALADEVDGIGFIRADAIAQSMGIDADSPNRIRAGLYYALTQLAKEGHVYSPQADLVDKCAEMLAIGSKALIQDILSRELFTNYLISDTLTTEYGEKVDAVYLKVYYGSEKGAANRLRDLTMVPSPITDELRHTDWEELLSDLAADDNVDLSDQQKGAVRAALANKVSILTGGPGTGKTTTLRMVIHALEALDFSFALASPTGRAAKRLSEATERSASTIHRLLGYIPGEGFTHDQDDPLDVDMVIVDEASMIDLLLFFDLLKALKPETHLMLVGDVDQLPSVGAGNVLRDVIASGVAYVTRLNLIFRQDEGSHIVVNAHRINNGDAPFLDNRSRDFYFFAQEDPVAAAELVVDIVKNRVQRQFGSDIDPLDDVQVIAPMYRGPIGVHALNEALQKALNGDKRLAEKQLSGRLFRAGDKVMQTRNNYDKEVFNGDIGRISGIDFEDQSLEVVFDGRYVYYEFMEADELIHAYCISTHRSQGSEYPIVVMPLMTQHYMMLQRNLLYTAVTRAKRAVVLVGSRKAVHMAVKNNKVAERYSGLLHRLRE